MWTVKALIESLKAIENQDAEVYITENQTSWDLVLAVIEDPSNPDERLEIQFE